MRAAIPHFTPAPRPRHHANGMKVARTGAWLLGSERWTTALGSPALVVQSNGQPPAVVSPFRAPT